MAQFCISSYSARMEGCGTKNASSTKSPAISVIRIGTSRFTPDSSLGGEETAQPGLAERHEHAADHDDDDQKDLDGVRGLEAPEEPRIVREKRARRVVLLADQRVIAGDHEE